MKRRARDWAFFTLAVAGLSVLLTAIITQPSFVGIRAEEGDVSKRTHKSPRTVTYKSDIKTGEAEQQASDAAAAIYRLDVTAPSQQEAKANAIFAAVNGVRSASMAPEEKYQRLAALMPSLSRPEAELLLGLDEGFWNETQSQLRAALGRLQQGQVRQDDLGRSESMVASQLSQNLPAPVRQAALILGERLLIPNYLIDEDATQTGKNRARDSVQPISYTVNRDQVIVYRGQLVSAFDAERLAAVGLTRPSFNLERSAGVFLLVLLFSSLLLGLAPSLTKVSLYRRRTMTLLSAFALIVTLVGVILVPVQPILAYIVPIAAPVLLVTVFYGFAPAIVTAVCYAAFFALATGGSFELLFIHLLASLGAVLFARRLSTSTGFIQSGVLVAVLIFAGILAFSLLSSSFSVHNVPKYLLAAGLNGALTATFVFAGAAFLGSAVGIVTFLQLLELENPRHPLLRRLASEMPGTYSHSLRISRLAERAAGEVGADPLLARVQALYHDIGKVSISEYFVENQQGGTNPHSKLSPRESADVLRSHISEGLSLAKQEGLPEQIARAIPEHHGTFRMSYFWEMAKKSGKQADQADYRYLGPKPQSKETAILMLADAVEAASRTLSNPDEVMVSELIQRLITERIDDGQLDETPLTTQELNRIKASFTQTIISDLHKRISYPDSKEPKSGKGRGQPS